MLKEIYDHFVVTPADKATANVAFICKRFYLEVHLKEVGISMNEQTKYTVTDKSHDLID